MSDWDFLHDMNNEGYSLEQIADAAACGYNPHDILDISEYVLYPDEWETVECGPIQKSPEVDFNLISVFENLVTEASRFYSITIAICKYGESWENYMLKSSMA